MSSPLKLSTRSESVTDFTTSHRLKLVKKFQDADSEEQKSYATTLNDVVGRDLLPEERDFLADYNSGRLSTSVHHRSPPGTPSTTFTDMHLERRENQLPSHAKKVIELYHQESQPGHTVNRKTRRGTRGGESRQRASMPLSLPPEPIPDRSNLAFDVSDMAASDASAGYRSPSRAPSACRDDDGDAPFRATLQQLTAQHNQAKRKYKECGQRMVELDAEMRDINGQILELGCNGSSLL